MTTRHPMALFVSFLASGIYCVILRGVRQWAQILFAGSGILLFAAGILPLFSHRGVTPLFYVNGLAVTWESVFYGIIMTFGCIAVVYGGGMSDGQREAAVPDRQDDTNSWIDADDDIPGSSGYERSLPPDT